MLHSLYIAYYLDRFLLVPIRTLYSTCHKLNESFVCVQVFQVLFATIPKLVSKSRVYFRGFVTEYSKEEIVKLLFTAILCWL